MWRPMFKEQDSFWFDPPVPDGESKWGVGGIDTTKTRDLHLKSDDPKSVKEWQKELYEGNFQIKQIKELYKISPEHPGIRFMPTMRNSEYIDPEKQGRRWIGPFFDLGGYGPKFFNKPLGEGCFEKTFAAAKYAFWATFFYSQLKSMTDNEIEVWMKPKTMLREFWKIGPMPIAMASMWGATLCAACAFREVDDWKNTTIAAAAAGAVWGTKQGSFAPGFKAFFITALLGIWWQGMRDSEEGLSGRQAVFKWYHMPLLWTKWNQGGDYYDVPAKNW